MALESTQLLTDMSTRNLPGGYSGRYVRLTSHMPMNKLSTQCGILNISHPCRLLRQFTGITLLFFNSSTVKMEGVCSS